MNYKHRLPRPSVCSELGLLRFESRQMMILLLLLLLLGACMGLAYDPVIEEEYGNSFRIRVLSRAHFVEFTPKYNSEVTILWKHDEPQAREDSRRKMIDNYFVITALTQKDSGRYIQRDKDRLPLSFRTIEVKEVTRNYTLKTDERLHFTFDLEPESCNIYFFPGGNHKTEIVRHGRLQRDLKQQDCVGFYLLKPCRIINKALQKTCSGRFEVRDHNDDKALVVFLDVEGVSAPRFDPSYLGIGGGVFVFTLLSCCVKYCCCGESSSEKDRSEASAEDVREPAVLDHEYDHDPVGPRPNQLSEPSQTPDPDEASNAPTGPLIHSFAAVDVPPPYSEVTAPTEQADAPTFPLNSEPEPRFELKGTTFNSAPPLSSVSPYCDVYTSDKFNFL